MKQWCGSYHFQGSPNCILVGKVKMLKDDLQVWDEEEFGDIGRKEEYCF